MADHVYFSVDLAGNVYTVSDMGEKGVIDGLLDISEITLKMTEDRTFELGGCRVKVADKNNFWTGLVAASQDFTAAPVAIRYGPTPTTGAFIFKGIVDELPDAKPGEFEISCAVRSPGLDNEGGNEFIVLSTEIEGMPISSREFGAGVPQNVGKFQAMPCIGNVDDSTPGDDSGMISLFRYSTSAAYKYLIGKMGPTTKTKVKVRRTRGNDVTSILTLTTDTPPATGRTYDIMTYASAQDEVAASVYSDGDLYEFLANAATYGWANLGAAVKLGFVAADVSGRGYSNLNVAIVCNEKRKGAEFLAELAHNFDMLPCPMVDQATTGRVVYMRPTLYGPAANYSSLRTLTGSHVDQADFTYRVKTNDVWKMVKRNYWWHWRKNLFQRSAIDFGIPGWLLRMKTGEVNQKFVVGNQISAKLAQRHAYFKAQPRIWYRFRVPLSAAINLEDAGDHLATGQILKLNVPFGYFPNADRIIQVYELTFSPMSGDAWIEAVDLSYIVRRIQDSRFLWVGVTDDTTGVVYDMAPTGNRACTKVGTVGIADVLTFTAAGNLTLPDSSDWDITMSTDAAIVVELTRSAGGLGVKNVICSHYQDASNFWEFYFTSENYLAFQLNVGGASVVSVTSSPTAITDTADPHVFAVVKQGDTWALFSDGLLIGSSATSSASADLAGLFSIGAKNSADRLSAVVKGIHLMQSDGTRADIPVGICGTAYETWNGYKIT